MLKSILLTTGLVLSINSYSQTYLNEDHLKKIQIAEEGTYQIIVKKISEQEIELPERVLIQISKDRLPDTDKTVIIEDFEIVIMSESKKNEGLKWSKFIVTN